MKAESRPELADEADAERKEPACFRKSGTGKCHIENTAVQNYPIRLFGTRPSSRFANSFGSPSKKNLKVRAKQIWVWRADEPRDKPTPKNNDTVRECLRVSVRAPIAEFTRECYAHKKKGIPLPETIAGGLNKRKNRACRVGKSLGLPAKFCPAGGKRERRKIKNQKIRQHDVIADPLAVLITRQEKLSMPKASTTPDVPHTPFNVDTFLDSLTDAEKRRLVSAIKLLSEWIISRADINSQSGMPSSPGQNSSSLSSALSPEERIELQPGQ